VEGKGAKQGKGFFCFCLPKGGGKGQGGRGCAPVGGSIPTTHLTKLLLSFHPLSSVSKYQVRTRPLQQTGTTGERGATRENYELSDDRGMPRLKPFQV